jgi:prolyl oligopeptidase PreP (S9A serine peptidase family)
MGLAGIQAALKQNRLRAYEDFAAVAKDLVQRGITSPKQLGIQGGSNGGLLVGNMVALYPELFFRCGLSSSTVGYAQIPSTASRC